MLRQCFRLANREALLGASCLQGLPGGTRAANVAEQLGQSPVGGCKFPWNLEGAQSYSTPAENGPVGGSTASSSGRHVDAAEVAKFGALASEWWDPEGSSAFLHRMNPLRTQFVRDAICSTFGRPHNVPLPLEGFAVLDVGCGGGLLSEALARLGAHVTGIDAAPEGIRVAKEHAGYDPAIADRTSYRVATAEDLVREGEGFDAVIASEVIEHVPDPPGFCAALAALTRTPGAVVISTLNRTPRAYALAIAAAEYVLRAVPVGTHDWKRFITPEELVMMTSEHGLQLERLSGMVYNPLSSRWFLSNDTAVNYIAAFSRTTPPVPGM